MRKRGASDGQPSLFDRPEQRPPARPKDSRAAAPAKRTWHMPELPGHTVAEIRLRWPKRLAPAQVARVEAALGALPKQPTQLGFGTVVVERVFVRRRRS